jgi:septin family protein
MSEPAPKSQMLRVSTALISAVRELSRLHREGHTTALLQRLQDVIAEIDSKTVINFIPTNTNTRRLEEKLDQLETQLKSDRQTLLQKLEKIETAIRTTRSNQNSRSRSNSYNPWKQPTV